MKPKYASLLIWLVVFYLFFSPLQDWARSQDFREAFSFLFQPDMTVLTLGSMVAFFAYSLVAYGLMFTFYPDRKWLGFGVLVILFPLVVFFRYFLQEVLQKALLGFGNYHESYHLMAYFWDNLYYGIVFTGVGLLFFFVQYSSFREARQKELELENQQSQLSFLRAQLNPHFLFNALNNIYALINARSDKSLRAVEKLSGLLRYALYEKSDLVPVGKEVRHLCDFIALEDMRHDYALALQVDLPEVGNELSIPPFLLIPFVENAFKHGNLQDAAHPVRIRLAETDTDLVFQVSNHKSGRQKALGGGVGLVNVQKRLALRYGADHQLDIRETESTFSVELKIARHRCLAA